MRSYVGALPATCQSVAVSFCTGREMQAWEVVVRKEPGSEWSVRETACWLALRERCAGGGALARYSRRCEILHPTSSMIEASFQKKLKSIRALPRTS